MTPEIFRKRMSTVIGVIKMGLFLAVLFAFTYISFAFYADEGRGKGAISWELIVFAQIIVTILTVLPMFYLLRTALWDIKNEVYTRNSVALMGVTIFIFYSLWSMYFSFLRGNPVIDFAGLICLAIGILDLRKIILAQSDEDRLSPINK